MADPAQLPPIFLPPAFLTRRRVIIACTNFRKRKIRCLTPEDPPLNPCDRCTKKGLKCEYVTISNQQADSNKNAPPDAESGGRNSSSSPEKASRTRSVAQSWGLDSHVHPQMYPSNPQSNYAHGSAPSVQYRPSQDRNPPSECSGSGGYDGTIQPHPFLYPARDFTPMPGYGTGPGRAQERDPYRERHWARCLGQEFLLSLPNGSRLLILSQDSSINEHLGLAETGTGSLEWLRYCKAAEYTFISSFKMNTTKPYTSVPKAAVATRFSRFI
ncbi:hypothetical protein B0H19DRAFT_1062965 [Mycena capillaripes]|nr:hypothetical protein B0H19DRAFT_1062965 [Mycena capillaripes]